MRLVQPHTADTAAAVRDLENDVCDMVRLSHLLSIVVGDDQTELVEFVAGMLDERIVKFRNDYFAAAFPGESRPCA